MNKLFVKFISLLLAIIFIVPASGFTTAFADDNLNTTEAADISKEVAVDYFNQAVNLIMSRYKFDITKSDIYKQTIIKLLEENPEMIYEVFGAMFGSLDDYTVYYSQEELDGFVNNVAGEFCGIGVVIIHIDRIPAVFGSIFNGAFNPAAVTGGIVGSMLVSMRRGVSRGIFSNEAGLGTGSIAHATSDVKDPVEQGYFGIFEVFIDTIIVCTLTALVILSSGIAVPYGHDRGIQITIDALSRFYGDWISIPIALALGCFAVATILGWGLYGIRCAQYLFGERVFPFFVVIQVITVLLGALLETGVVWLLAETVNGLMAIPNLITLILLGPVFFRLIKEYKSIR